MYINRFSTTRKIRPFQTNTTRSIGNHPVIKNQSPIVWFHNIKYGSSKYPKWKRLQTQTGGARIEKSGYMFVYDDTGDTILCVTKKPHNGMCFRIDFDKDLGRIGIDISYYAGCSHTKPLPKSSGTLVMLQVILELIVSKRHIERYKYIQLTDNSSVECTSYKNGKKEDIPLMDMYFVSTGCTWYSSIAPMFLINESDEIEYIKYKSHILNSLSWNDLLEKFPHDVRNAFNEVIQFENSDTAKEPAYTILNKIRERRDHCALFKYYMEDILYAFGVKSMAGKSWCIPLKDGKIVSCDDDELTMVCKHPEKGWILSSTYITNVSLDEFMHIKKSIQRSVDIPYNYQLEKINTPTLLY